ncbi:MAG: polysaccharide deacetylase family protein [Synergistaceae bacterium]|nr:polysaccharide deacetylase family protein [Synergistaceae bacterium]
MITDAKTRTNIISWPNGKGPAVLVTLNLDAGLFAKAYHPDVKIEGSSYERKGKTGLELRLERILGVLESCGVKCTAFVPGWTAERYPWAVRLLHERGHEVGSRAYAQENLALLSSRDQKDAIEKGAGIIKDVCGCFPKGFRAPWGEITTETLEIVHELGFLYSSSLNDEDVPYFNKLEPSGRLLLEIPVHWALCDLPYFIFDFFPPIPYGQSRISCFEKVLLNWKWEYDGACRCNSCYVLQLDPTTMGEPGNIFMLEELLEYMKRAGDPWFATCGEVYDFMMSCKEARTLSLR